MDIRSNRYAAQNLSREARRAGFGEENAGLTPTERSTLIKIMTAQLAAGNVAAANATKDMIRVLGVDANDQNQKFQAEIIAEIRSLREGGGE